MLQKLALGYCCICDQWLTFINEMKYYCWRMHFISNETKKQWESEVPGKKYNQFIFKYFVQKCFCFNIFKSVGNKTTTWLSDRPASATCRTRIKKCLFFSYVLNNNVVWCIFEHKCSLQTENHFQMLKFKFITELIQFIRFD